MSCNDRARTHKNIPTFPSNPNPKLYPNPKITLSPIPTKISHPHSDLNRATFTFFLLADFDLLFLPETDAFVYPSFFFCISRPSFRSGPISSRLYLHESLYPALGPLAKRPRNDTPNDMKADTMPKTRSSMVRKSALCAQTTMCAKATQPASFHCSCACVNPLITYAFLSDFEPTNRDLARTSPEVWIETHEC